MRIKKWLLVLIGFVTTFPLFSQTNNEWARTFGNSSNSSTLDMIRDNSGNIYSVGYFSGNLDFDPGINTHNLSFGGSAQDGFVQKLDSNGNFLWATGFGAPSWTGSIQHASCRNITCDDSNNVYITGNFIISADFDPGPGVHTVPSNANDIFILKLNSLGEFVWVRTMGSVNGGNIAQDIVYDPAGYIYTTGYFDNEVDFNTGTGVQNISSVHRQGFIHKLDVNGNFIWVKTTESASNYTSGSGSNIISLDIDQSSNLYAFGRFSGVQDFDPGLDSTLLTSNNGSLDCFILKLDSSGNFSWVKNFGNDNFDKPEHLVIDNDNSLYMTGTFSDSLDVDPGLSEYFLTSDSLTDVFVLKLDENGIFETAYSLNSSLETNVNSLSIDSDKNLYISGKHRGVLDYDPSDAYLLSTLSASFEQNFFLKTDSNHNLEWAKTVTDNYLSGGLFLIPDESSNAVYASGYYYDSLDFSSTIDTGTFVSQGGSDVFIMKFEECNPSHGTHSVNACGAYTWMDSTIYTTDNTTMTFVLPNAAVNGCDSIVHLDLTISSPSTSIDTRTACESLIWIDGQTYSSNNTTATHTLTNSTGCDSVVTLNLTLNNSTSTLTETACFMYTSPSGQELTASGTFQDTITNAFNCDSVITINLTINTIDLTLSQIGSTLQTNETGATYQWLDCDNNYSVINGETSSTYTPTQNGNYALEIQKNGCVDTTACHSVQNVSLYEFTDQDLQVFPNPIKDHIQLVFLDNQKNLSIRIENILGQNVYTNQLEEGKTIDLQFNQPTGVYLLHVTSHSGQKQFIKLVKE